MKIVTVVGARPQFIKAATVSRQVRERDGVEDVIIHTGQHYDAQMSDVFFESMDIPKPNYNLEIGGGTHGAMTGQQLERIEAVLMDEKPDWVLVYGDTNSTLAGALAAAKLHIPVAHVESGLRSFNRRMPEEINRVLTDHVATLLFVPSQLAVDNLALEGITGDQVVNVGDVMYDASLIYAETADTRSQIIEELGLEPGKFRLCTCHRQENVDDPRRLAAIFSALRELSNDMPLVLPLHPRTRKMLEATGNFDAMVAGLTITEPVGFFDIFRLMRDACMVLTDSGGLQKEAYFHGTPVVVLRDETEWKELVDMGWAKLADPESSQEILSACVSLTVPDHAGSVSPYGNGDAAQKILDRLLAG